MRALPAAALLFLTACHGTPEPVEVDVRNDACAWCRMGVSDRRTAAQLVAPLEEPRFFDDVGCLRDYLAGGATVPAGAVAYVADHRTREWVLAARAAYAQTPALATPMSSGIAAWADPSSRAADPSVPQAAAPRSPAEIFGPGGPPQGTP